MTPTHLVIRLEDKRFVSYGFSYGLASYFALLYPSDWDGDLNEKPLKDEGYSDTEWGSDDQLASLDDLDRVLSSWGVSSQDRARIGAALAEAGEPV